MKTNREKQLTIALLTEKLQKLTGKKVKLTEGVEKVPEVVFPNGLSFKVGEQDQEGNQVIFINKYSKGYEVGGQEFDWNSGEFGDEGYAHYYNLDGDEKEEDQIVD